MTSLAPTVLSLFVGQPESLGIEGAAAWYDDAWQTAIFKRPIAGPVAVTALGLVGDGHADLVNHGGLDKAVCVYPSRHYPVWREALVHHAEGGAVARDFDAGAFGENVTLSTVTEHDVCIGDRYAAGTLVVEVSQPRQPCWKLARKWRIKDLTAQAVANGHTGWYFRVVHEGSLAVGDTLTLLSRPYPAWTIAAANLVMHHRVGDTAALSQIDPLSESWKRTLRSRLV